MVQDKRHIFKAYDIRGIYPDDIEEGVVFEIVSALVEHFRGGKIIVGHDARLSSPSLYKTVLNALSWQHFDFDKKGKGFRPAKPINIVRAGLITTPMMYFLVNHFKAQGGIMITASHNPKQFNGLKVVGPKAAPISGKEIYRMAAGK